MREALLSKSNREHRHSRGACSDLLQFATPAACGQGLADERCLLFWTADVLEKMFSPRSLSGFMLRYGCSHFVAKRRKPETHVSC